MPLSSDTVEAHSTVVLLTRYHFMTMSHNSASVSISKHLMRFIQVKSAFNIKCYY